MVEDSHRRPDRNRRAPEARARRRSAPNIILNTRECYIDEWPPSCDRPPRRPDAAINQLGLFLKANNLRLTISEAIVSPKSQ
jgi:hypothetical protein